MPDDFGDKEFTTEPVYGFRRFNRDSRGRLSGVTYPDIWRPGENLARCHLRGEDPISHEISSCKCGFYAYYDVESNYKSDSRVLSLIKGYGEVLVGSKGFRATKASLEALVLPAPRDDVAEFSQYRLKLNYPGVAIFNTVSDLLDLFSSSLFQDDSEDLFANEELKKKDWNNVGYIIGPPSAGGAIYNTNQYTATVDTSSLSSAMDSVLNALISRGPIIAGGTFEVENIVATPPEKDK